MRVPLVNSEGGSGVLLFNFEGGPGVPLINFRVPDPGSQDPEVLGLGVLVPLLHHAVNFYISFSFLFLATVSLNYARL